MKYPGCPRCNGKLDIHKSYLSQKHPWIAECHKCKIAFMGTTKYQAARNLNRWEKQ